MHALRKTLCVALILGSTTIAAAADKVTVVQRSGEKITGDLDGQVNDRIYIRKSLEEQPKIPIDQIMMIEVGDNATNLPESEVNDARGDTHLLVMQDGSKFKGHFVRVEGPEGAPAIQFQTDSGEKKSVPINQLRRLYLGHYKDSASTSTAPSSSTQAVGAGERVISVAANAEWVDTGITVRQGDKVTFSASGEVTLSADPNDKAKPGGSVSQRRAANAPVQSATAGTLIGRIGRNARAAAGPAFAIGDSKEMTMPSTGRLFLGVNDDGAGDNSGQFEVRIKVDRAGS
jgi:PA-IL-like protein